MAATVAHCVLLPAPRGGCVPRLRACSAGLDGTQKGYVSQPAACGPTKPVPRLGLTLLCSLRIASRVGGNA